MAIAIDANEKPAAAETVDPPRPRPEEPTASREHVRAVSARYRRLVGHAVSGHAGELPGLGQINLPTLGLGPLSASKLEANQERVARFKADLHVEKMKIDLSE